MGVKLSILIPSVHTRRNTFLPNIQDALFSQLDTLEPHLKEQVEVIVLLDNKKRMLGSKRNDMVSMAQGEYYVMADDDDRISPSYVRDLLDGTQTGADVITFKAEVTINGQSSKICTYTKDIAADYNTPDAYFRLPNHICAVKREIGMQISFPNIKYGEDAAYSKLLKPLLKTEHHIDRVLYYYDFNEQTTETQEHIRENRTKIRTEQPPIADVVILSNAKDESYREMTQEAVDSCIRAANGLRVNVIVVEQDRSAEYKNCSAHYLTSAFNYNRFANFGANQGGAPNIVIANNDLIFEDGWLHNLLAADHPLVSPKCPAALKQRDVTENEIGDENGKHLSGWCFLIKRKLWEEIGGFDTDVSFWYSDDVTIEQCRAKGVLPMIVPGAVVRHKGSQTLITSPKETFDDFTWGQTDIFNRKYNKAKFIDHPGYIEWKSKQVK